MNMFFMFSNSVTS